MAALTTCARLPAPATPIKGRAEIKFVKYKDGIPSSLPFWTTGVVPIARDGLIASTAAQSSSKLALNLTIVPFDSNHSLSFSDHLVFGQTVPT